MKVFDNQIGGNHTAAEHHREKEEPVEKFFAPQLFSGQRVRCQNRDADADQRPENRIENQPEKHQQGTFLPPGGRHPLPGLPSFFYWEQPGCNGHPLKFRSFKQAERGSGQRPRLYLRRGRKPQPDLRLFRRRIFRRCAGTELSGGDKRSLHHPA